jgi:CHAT domain-containing protein/tetratricopeptide (TPR) repeat protein
MYISTKFNTAAVYCFAGLLLLFARAAVAQQNIEVKQGTSLERVLTGGQSHNYQIRLLSGQFLDVVVEQMGIDVELILSAPDGRQIAHTDSTNGSWGPESMVAIADVDGEYGLRVASGDPHAPSGKYRIRVDGIRTATATDQEHVLANRAVDQAVGLFTRGDSTSLRQAADKFRVALNFYRSSDRKYGEALTLYSLGMVEAQLGNFRAALAEYNQCLPLFRLVADRSLEGSTLNNMAGAFDVLGDTSKALESYDQALPLLRLTNDRVNEAVTLNNIGKINADMGDWQRASDYYRQALPIFHQTGDRVREAITLTNLGTLSSLLGQSDQALNSFQLALPLHRSAGNKRGEADTLVQMGGVYRAADNMRDAKRSYEEALELDRAIGDHWREGNALRLLGAAYSATGEQQKALESLEQSRTLLRAANDARAEGLTLFVLGDAYRLSAKPQDAATAYRQSLALLERVGDRDSSAKALLGLAKVERDQNQLPEARKHAEEALALVEQVRSHAGAQEDRASYFATQQSMGEFYIDLLMRMHKEDPGAGHDVEAFNAAERARARSLLEMLAEARVDFRRGVDPKLLAKEHELSGLLNSKAQRLLTLRGAGTEDKAAALKKEISDLEDQYRQVELEIRKDSPEYAAVTQPQPLTLKEIQGQVLDGDTVLLEYALGEERSYLWLVSTTGLKTYELPKRSEIDRQVREVVELLKARGTYVRAELPDHKRARIAQADAQLPQAAARLSKMVLAPAARDLGNKRLVLVTDGSLQHVPFAMLPVARSAQAETAAVQASSRYLVEDHEIVSLPSASTIAELRKETTGRKPAPGLIAVLADPVFEANDPRVKIAPAEAGKAAKAKAPITGSQTAKHSDEAPKAGSGKAEQIALAENTPSSQTKADASGAQQSSRADDTSRILEHLAAGDAAGANGQLEIPRLPFTRQEADRIMKLASAKDSMEALDFRASLATATSPELGRYRYLHFATHGYLDSEHPELSAIVLSLVDRNGHAEPGFLRANDIYNLKLPADLVVLSACETGLGKEIRGEGIVGLTRGFMYAGSPRVIVSLWSVNDRATEELMAAFYQKLLKEKLSPAAALRQAQVTMLREKQWTAPYYWAAFVEQGEWR